MNMKFNRFKKNKKRKTKLRNLNHYLNKGNYIISKNFKKTTKKRLRRKASFALDKNPKSDRLLRHVLLKNQHIKKFNYQMLGIKHSHWYYLPSFIEINYEILNFIILNNPLTENILTGFSYNSFLKSYIRFNKRHGF